MTEKLYKVQMNSKGMPNFSTAIEVEPTADDLISRADAIKAIKRVCRDNRCLTFIEHINRLPSAHTERGEWIPCSERLPRRDEHDYELGVLVTLGNGYSGLQYDTFQETHWCDWDGYVTAWMPLPKPFNADRKTDQVEREGE